MWPFKKKQVNQEEATAFKAECSRILAAYEAEREAAHEACRKLAALSNADFVKEVVTARMDANDQRWKFSAWDKTVKDEALLRMQLSIIQKHNGTWE